MMKTPEELTDSAREALGDQLKSVVLYGSAARGDAGTRGSDFNILMTLENLSRSNLDALIPIVKKWKKGGNPPPLLFTEKRIKQAEDVFPIEFLDISQGHKVLFGEDPFLHFQVNKAHLRHQLEFELRGKLIHLRQAFLGMEGKPKEIEKLLLQAISSFSILFKGVLALGDDPVPPTKKETVSALAKQCPIDEAVFVTLLDAKKEGTFTGDPLDLFDRFLSSIEQVVDFVDAR